MEDAYSYIADLREAWPECLKGIKTAQLVQETLMYKEKFIKELGQTGLLFHCDQACLICEQYLVYLMTSYAQPLPFSDSVPYGP